jgi:hypothetical protein
MGLVCSACSSHPHQEVIERERAQTEIDGLRYYCPDDPTTVLWEEWMYVSDLGVQLGPVIARCVGSLAC